MIRSTVRINGFDPRRNALISIQHRTGRYPTQFSRRTARSNHETEPQQRPQQQQAQQRGAAEPLTEARSSSPPKSTASVMANSSWIVYPTSFGIGTIAGGLGSLAGMGGGFVMIPLLTHPRLPLRLSQHAAHGTSLAAVTATGLAGAYAYQEYVDTGAAAAIAGTAILTAVMGANVANQLSSRALRKLLGYFLLVLGPSVMPVGDLFPELSLNRTSSTQPETLYHNEPTTSEATMTDSISAQQTASDSIQNLTRYIPPALIGIISGFLAGLFGVGGGTIVVPALTHGYSFPAIHATIPPNPRHADMSAASSGTGSGGTSVSLPGATRTTTIATTTVTNTTHHQALGTSLAAMILPAAIGTRTHARAGNVMFHVAPGLATGALCGAYLGGRLAVDLEESTLRWGFSILLTMLGIKTLRR